MMGRESIEALVQCGRRFSVEELEEVCETVALFASLARRELLATVCEHLGWYTAGGGLKEEACEKLLMKLEAAGHLELPKKRGHGGKPKKIRFTARTAARPPIGCSLRELSPLGLRPLEGAEKSLVNEYLARYHPLGYRRPFGYRMRYLIESQGGPLGCFLLAGAAKALGKRDRWIGWTEVQRLQRLPWVVGLSRHLILPWVEVPNLSSHVLALLCARIREDWQRRWGYEPVLLETFVDPRYEGSSYKAAGWQRLGMTTGEGLLRPGCEYTTSRKWIFVKALVPEFREHLCSVVPPAAANR
jgi:hypothetical protein